MAVIAILDDGEDVFLASANRFIRTSSAVGCGGDFRRLGSQRALLLDPFLATTINEARVLVSIILQLPKSIGGEPIVVVAVEQNRRVVGDAGPAEQMVERLFGDQIPTDVILKLSLPVPADSAGNVALIVSAGVDVDFHQTNFGVVQVLGSPFRRYQDFRVLVFSHVYLLNKENRTYR